MKRVYFNQIKIKNFLSIGETPIEICFRSGVNIVTGINKDKLDRRNGIGKSTIADAINFAIFGEPLRNISKNNIQNNITGGRTDVSLSFDIIDSNSNKTTYKINRTLSPTRCSLYVNGQDKTESTMSNTNAYIKKILHATPELFQNCVLMSVNSTVPFMAQKKVEKKKFIESILRLEFFSLMMSDVRAEYLDTYRKYELSCKDVDNYEEQYNLTLKRQKDSEKHTKELIELYTRDILNKESFINSTSADDISSQTSRVEELYKKITDIESKIEDQRQKENLLSGKIHDVKGKIKLLKDKLNAITDNEVVCDACLRSLSLENIDNIKVKSKAFRDEIQQLKELFSKYNNKKDIIQSNIVKLSGAIHQVRSKIDGISRKIAKHRHNKELVNTYRKEIEDIKVKIQDVTNKSISIAEIAKDIKNIKTKKELAIKEKSILGKEFKVLEYVKHIVSEEGVKSYIVKKILGILNSRLAYYLNKMDSNCICSFDEFFNELIINDKGCECDYFNFSGAERKNIDLACLFAFMDLRMMQGDISYNILFFDELFDSSLDEKGVDLVLELLKDRIENNDDCIYIISHRKESIKACTNEVIYLEKIWRYYENEHFKLVDF
jgi:DNA repair exonuclease SbcCD ATPase subunit